MLWRRPVGSSPPTICPLPHVAVHRRAIHTGLAATGFVLSTTAYVVAEGVFNSTTHPVHGNLGIAVMVRNEKIAPPP